jgi:hypothetical protein
MKKNRKLGKYDVHFRTTLNETMNMIVYATSKKNAINKMLKEFPIKKHGTFDIEC